jgi:alanine dehydrogenase
MQVVRDAVARELLTMDATISALRTALQEEQVGSAVVPARTTIENPLGGSWIRTMPGITGAAGYMGAKLMYSHESAGVAYVVLLVSVDPQEAGQTVLLDANWITTIRTAAAAAIATDALCSSNVGKLALIGTGTQARALLDALCAVRRPALVSVYSRSAQNRKRFVKEARLRLGLQVMAADTIETALADADLVGSSIRAGGTPILLPSMITKPDAHINALSSVRPEAREVDVELWRSADLVVVDHAQDVRSSGDGIAADEAGLPLVEMVELHALDDFRCAAHAKLTLYKSVGSALQDLSVAAYVYERARELGRTEEVREFPTARLPQRSVAEASDQGKERR